MKQLKVLKISEKNLIFCGILPRDGDERKLKKILTNILVITGCVYSLAVCGTAYIVHNPQDVAGAANAFICVFAGISMFGSYIGMLANEQNIICLHRDIQSIVDNVKKPNIFECYDEAEKKSQLLTRWVDFVLFKGYVYTGLFPIYIHSIWCIFRGNFDTSGWHFPVAMDVPFNTETVFGWWMRAIIFTSGTYAYFSIILCVVPYLASCCFYIVACCKHLKLIFDEFDEMVSVDQCVDQFTQIEEFSVKMKRVIALHAQIMEIFQLAAEIGSSTFFSFLLSNVAFFAASVYNLEEELKKVGIKLFFCIGCISIGLLWPFILCNSAASATIEVANIGNSACYSKYYEYPLKMRKYLILIMVRSQSPVYFTGLKLIRCTLEVFMKLNRTACSYYIMFRNLSAR